MNVQHGARRKLLGRWKIVSLKSIYSPAASEHIDSTGISVRHEVQHWDNISALLSVQTSTVYLVVFMYMCDEVFPLKALVVLLVNLCFFIAEWCIYRYIDMSMVGFGLAWKNQTLITLEKERVWVIISIFPLIRCVVLTANSDVGWASNRCMNFLTKNLVKPRQVWMSHGL